MYKVKDLDWLPKPNTFSFVKRKLSNYKYTSSIILAIYNQRLLLVNVKSRGWDFVGGRIEDDESIKECARREFIEETGFEPKNLRMIGSNKINCKNNPKGNKTAQAIYICKIKRKLSDKLEEDICARDFFSLNELQQFDFHEWKLTLINHVFSLQQAGQ